MVEPKKEVSYKEKQFPYVKRYLYQFRNYTKDQLEELLSEGLDMYNELVRPSVEVAAEELLKKMEGK